MNSKKWGFNPHGFFALYNTIESAKPMSMQDCANEMTKEFKMYFEKTKVSRIVAQTKDAIVQDAALRAEYETYKVNLGTPKGYLFKLEIQPDGSEQWMSPYPEGKRFLLEKANNKGLKDMCRGLNLIYENLGRLPPAKWTYEIVKPYLDKRKAEFDDAAFHEVVMIRNLLPQRFMQHGETPLSTKQYKRSAAERVKTYDVFTNEVEGVLKHIENEGFWYIAGLHRLHLMLGCREGSKRNEVDEKKNAGGRGGILGLRWQNINVKRNTIDVFEGKTKGGILWKGCPLDNFGWNLQPFIDRVRNLKEVYVFTIPLRDGEVFDVIVKPSTEHIFNISYTALIKMYDYIEIVYEKMWQQTNKFDKITPHTARHLHTNLLFERGVSSTVICGDALRGTGYVGVGWTDKTTMETYYLSLVERTVQQWITAAKATHGTFTPFAEVAAGSA